MLKITPDIVNHVAKLSRIQLEPGEGTTYARHLSSIVGYVDQLEKIDTTNTEPLLQVSGLKNVLREDKVTNTNMREQLLTNAPAHENGFIKVKTVK